MDRKNSIFFLQLLFFLNFIFSNEQYVSFNKVVSEVDSAYKTDYVSGTYVYLLNGKKIKFIEDSSYLMIDEKVFFTGGIIYKERSDFFIPLRFVNKFKDIVNDNVFVDKSEEKSTIDRKNILKNNQKEDEKNNQIKPESINREIIHSYIYDEKPDEFKINAIIIDPGHGGRDPGTYNNNLMEKDIVLKTSLIVEEKLKKKFNDKHIIMTRKKDFLVQLEDRAEIANKTIKQYGPTLFVSIHVNASPATKAYGFETWYLVDRYERNFIKKGQVSDHHDVEMALNSMVNDEVYHESRALASSIQKRLNEFIGNVSRDRGVKESTYIVVKNSYMPAVLVEIGFLSNKYEAKRLTNNEYLNKIAEAITLGIGDFINDYEHSQGFTR